MNGVTINYCAYKSHSYWIGYTRPRQEDGKRHENIYSGLKVGFNEHGKILQFHVWSQ